MNNNIFTPLDTFKWIDRDTLIPNDYNPNKVLKDNLMLLTRSILVNGWTLPIVIRPDNTIVDGFHRWTVAGPEWDYIPKFTAKEQQELNINPEYIGKTLYEILGGKVPVVTVRHQDESAYIYGTITHNRARGTHLLEPMKAIVQRLFDAGKTVDEISSELGMKAEEVFRLSNFTREDFLQIMVDGNKYSNAEWVTKI